MNGYEEKIKDRLFLEVCNAAGREEWDGLAHQQKENLMLVCRLSGYDEKDPNLLQCGNCTFTTYLIIIHNQNR